MTDTDLNAILQFKMEPQFSLVTKRGNRGSQIGEFNWPCNLTASTNGDVYVAYSYNNRVQILNGSLQHLRSLTEQLIESPRDIKLTADEVHVLCLDNHCLHVSSPSGERLRSLMSRGDRMQVTNPLYLNSVWLLCFGMRTLLFKYFHSINNFVCLLSDIEYNPLFTLIV